MGVRDTDSPLAPPGPPAPPAPQERMQNFLHTLHENVLVVHLSQRWEYVTSLYESGKLEEESGSESQEVLEDMLVRHLTREHLEVLKVSLVEGTVSTEYSNVEMEEDICGGGGGSRAPDHVSELGAMVLADPVAGPAVLHTVC
ncbi:unnamed protein product [Leptidea sinapis]|uniref:Exportin-5 C-terminal domain-containing protein n=1 Tax=Leptidea sinapis TaxID=189913 RepID=A0A5E4QZL9_9NEOP|nr:unnamed protein product [Leptidea sinapis]